MQDVEEAVPDILFAGKQALNWWWNGLSPAEKIDAAALAEMATQKLTIREEGVIQVLASHAIPLQTEEMELALRDLVKRRILQVTGEQEYGFCIELFRRWVHQDKPLRRVKYELNLSVSRPEQLFKNGLSVFRRGLWDAAIQFFTYILQANPFHFGARLYLGQALLELGQIDEAVASLSRAYELDQQKGKAALLLGLLSQVEANHKAGEACPEGRREEGVLRACERILLISPTEPTALARRAAIWNQRGDVALARDDFSVALRAYQEAGNQAKMAEVEALQRKQTLVALEIRAQAHASLMRWASASAIYQQLISQALDEESRAVWQTAQAHCTDSQELAHLVRKGVSAMQQGSWEQAVAAFLRIVNRRVAYQKDGRRATQLLDQVAKETPPISFPAPFFRQVPPTDLSGTRREPPIRSYRNFDLRLAIKQRNQLLVEVLSSPAGEAMGRAFISESIEWDIEDQLRPLSQELGHLLMPGEVRHCFEASRGMVYQTNEGLRIRLRIHGEALSTIPWEAARIGDEYLSLQPHTPLVRYVQASEPPSPLAVRGALQVLGIISNPTDLATLDVSTERVSLEKALAPLINSGRVNLIWLPRADTQLLQDALRQNPAVIHFIGHGQYDEYSQKGALWFTDAEGYAEPLSADWLATLLRGTSVRFVFLNACESGRAAGGLASVLVRRGIPAVLGMQTSVEDELAIALAAGFYKALRDGWPVDAALVEGRKAIVNAVGNDPDKADWAYPVLYMRAPDGRLFE